MDAIISKILEIEHRSCQIIKEAEDKRDALDSILEAKQEEIRQAIFAEGAKQLENDKILYLNKAKKEAYFHEKYAKEKITALEDFQQKHREEWLAKLYNRIIKDGK